MREKIAMGFHATVDFELEWNRERFLSLVSKHRIRDQEICGAVPPDSERNMLLITLAYMKEGSGAEFTPTVNELCVRFAEHFSYRRTLGGTATRAALAISRLGYGSELSICCFNRFVREGFPENIHYFSNVGEGREEVYPHVIFTYPSGVRIAVNDIDFVTPRENRIMFSNDEDSKNMAVSREFLPRMSNAEVFLLGCFSEVLDFEVLKRRLKETKELLAGRNRNTLLVFEDGCYIHKEFRSYVHKKLTECRLDVLSMNEDELQEYAGKRFDILDEHSVLKALEQCRDSIGVPLLVVHSSKWALSYGVNAETLRKGLAAGICLSATSFCHGSRYGREEFFNTASMVPSREGEAFCERIKKLAGECVCALPTKDLSEVKNPTVVGLGDCFAGGLALGLTDTDFIV